MSIDWRLYEARVKVENTGLRDSIIKKEHEALRKQMPVSPGMHDVLINDEPAEMLVQSSDNEYLKTFKMPVGKRISCGDVVTWAEERWIVTHVDFDDTITIGGRMRQCNHRFCFQTFDGKIHYRWGVLDSGVYSTTQKATDDLMVLDKQYKIYLPFDNDTKKIHIDKRIATERTFDKTGKELLVVYRITGRDSVSSSFGSDGHLLLLFARSDLYNEQTDNLDNMICDYISEGSEEPPPAGLMCEINGKKNVRTGIGSRTYTPIFYDADGATKNDVLPVWDVDYPPICDGAINVEYDGASVVLTAKSDTKIIGQTVSITLQDDMGAYTPAAIDVEVVAGV